MRQAITSLSSMAFMALVGCGTTQPVPQEEWAFEYDIGAEVVRLSKDQVQHLADFVVDIMRNGDQGWAWRVAEETRQWQRSHAQLNLRARLSASPVSVPDDSGAWRQAREFEAEERHREILEGLETQKRLLEDQRFYQYLRGLGVNVPTY